MTESLDLYLTPERRFAVRPVQSEDGAALPAAALARIRTAFAAGHGPAFRRVSRAAAPLPSLIPQRSKTLPSSFPPYTSPAPLSCSAPRPGA